MFLVEGTADANAVGVRADGGSGPAGERLLAAFPRATAGVRVQVLGEKHVMEDYHIWHVDNVGMPGLGHPTFLGVPVQKSLNNLWKTQEILHELRPGFIVKFGWLRGGLALYYTNTIAYSDDTGRPGPFEAVEAFERARPGWFSHDTARETKCGFTWNPRGFMRRPAVGAT